MSKAELVEEKGVVTGGQQAAQLRVIICGPPNVGKSLIFNRLTGSYANVSNYPGTTVEISSAQSTIIPDCRIMDTPGAYSLLPISEEERVSREILMKAGDAVVLHVVDSKNLRRMIPMTLELLELELKVVLVLNMQDEADRHGISVDTVELGRLLGIPVVKTTATKGAGITDVARIVSDGCLNSSIPEIDYETAYRAMGLRTEGMPGQMDSQEDANEANRELAMRTARQQYADRVLSQCAVFPPPAQGKIGSFLNYLTFNIWTAVPLALAVIYFGVYEFVGVFGAGTLVDFLETTIYETYLTPHITAFVEKVIPWVTLQDLFVHDYGILTLGLRYAIALILPIVGTFFLLFSVLEDSGYLPRLALLLDRVFKKIGLNGRAVIPIVLGFGCGTMATMVTRILETKRERIIATLLLGVAIPCSAQIGVILAMLAGHPSAFIAWGLSIAAIFMLLGTLAARKLPGEIPSFYLELPPLRWPKMGNVFSKTYSRMHWYFIEILPLFLAASVVIWIGNVTGVFNKIISAIAPIINLMGLPREAASSFLFGFFRRDYGAAGLFELQRDGSLNARQSFVAVLVITLFLPCIAQFFVMKKERGWKFALLTTGSIMSGAAITGVVANFILAKTGWM